MLFIFFNFFLFIYFVSWGYGLGIWHCKCRDLRITCKAPCISPCGSRDWDLVVSLCGKWLYHWLSCLSWRFQGAFSKGYFFFHRLVNFFVILSFWSVIPGSFEVFFHPLSTSRDVISKNTNDISAVKYLAWLKVFFSVTSTYIFFTLIWNSF